MGFSNLLDLELSYLQGEVLKEGLPAASGAISVLECAIECDLPAQDVLYQARQLMCLISESGRVSWPSNDDWLTVLPPWFLKSCRSEMTAAEADKELSKWRRLRFDQKAIYDRTVRWTAKSWLYSMRPGDRHWYWLGTRIINEHAMVALIAVEEWPFAWGTLSWLFRSAGAKTVELDD